MVRQKCAIVPLSVPLNQVFPPLNQGEGVAREANRPRFTKLRFKLLLSAHSMPRLKGVDLSRMDPMASPGKLTPVVVRFRRMVSRIVPLLCGLAVLLAFSCARAEASTLVGSWWDLQGQSVTDDQALDRLRDAPVILLGEVHDSQPIHRRQIELLNALNAPLVLALEQLDLGGDGEIDRLNAESFENGRARAQAGGFDFDGWGWEHYGPLFDWATERRVPLWPLNLSREKAMAVAMADGAGWRAELDADALAWVDEIAPELSLPTEQQRGLVEVLEQSHCQEIPADMSSRMVRAQVARDVLMAKAIMAAREAYPDRQIIAVMGNQHARLDRGVGYWLAQVAGKTRLDVMSVGMVPINHLSDTPGPDDAFDLRLIMPEVSREDPCAPAGETE